MVYNQKLRKEVEVIDIVIVLVIISIYLLMLINYNFFKSELSTGIELSGLIGLFFTSAVLDFIPQLFDPGFGVFIALASGMTLLASTIIIILGSAFGGILGYELGRKYGLRFIIPLFTEKALKKTLNFFDRYGKYIVLVGAITPLPYFPMIFGALKLNRKQFWLFGVLPRALSFILFSLAIYAGINLWSFF